MKGGSIASQNVTSGLSSDVFARLNSQFDGLFVGGGKKKSQKTTAKDNAKKHGGMCPAMCGGAKKKVAPKTDTKKQSNEKKHGGTCTLCGGAKGGSAKLMKHMNEFNDDGAFNLYNKKGGSAPPFEMKYDYDASLAKPAHGAFINRGVDTTQVSLMANETPSSLGSLNKFVQYGNISGSYNMPFSYGGGVKKTKVASKPVKKVTFRTIKTVKPAKSTKTVSKK